MAKSAHISSFEEFQRALALIAHELVTANTLLHLVRRLGEAVPDYYESYNDAPVFWQVTMFSHYTTCVVTLYRVFDTRADVLSFPTVLRSLKDNIEAIINPTRAQVSGDPGIYAFFSNRLGAIIDDVREVRNLSGKLAAVRHNEVAHLNYEQFVIKRGEPIGAGLAELELIINGGYDLLDKYSSFGALESEHNRTMEGRDDFQSVLLAIEAHHRLKELHGDAKTPVPQI